MYSLSESQAAGTSQYGHNHVEEENTRAESELASKVTLLKSVRVFICYAVCIFFMPCPYLPCCVLSHRSVSLFVRHVLVTHMVTTD